MSVTMHQPLQYPFYMDTPRFRLPAPWSSVPFHFPAPRQQQFYPSYPMSQPLSPYVFSQQNNSISRINPSSSSFSNTRYHHLKKSTSCHNRHSVHRSLDVPTRPHRYSTYHEPIRTEQYRSSKTQSISNLEQIPEFTSAPLSKAHSWHAMMNHRRSNLSVAYANEIHLSPKRPRKNSLKKKKRNHPQRRLSSSPPKRKPSLPKRKPSFQKLRQRPIQIPECGIVRISTLDEMPVNTKQMNSVSNERLSTKGSISNLSIRQTKSKGNNSIKNRKIKINNKNDEGIRMDTSTDTLSSSSLSSTHSHSSLQQRLNGSLRNDPLITAAMEDLRQFRRSSSQNTLFIPSSRGLGHDSLHSDSSFHSSSSSISGNHSQSSFTSQERSEIRQLIKTIKKKDKKSSSPIPSSELSITTTSHSSTSLIKPKKSCITEELDREFNKLRARDPEQEITYVTPSSICKRKQTHGKSCKIIPPLPTLDELLRQVQLRPVDRSSKSIPLVKEKTTNDVYEKTTEDVYENPLSPVPVPRCSPIPSPVETNIEETKHEYAVPIKKTEEKPLLQLSHFQPMRNFSFTKPITNTIPEKRPIRPLSMFNWFHSNSTNPVLSTFQPNRILDHQNEHGTTSVKENIYTSDIEVYLPTSTIEKNDDNSLQIHLDNQTIITDDFYSEYETQQTTNSSSILNDFSHLFARKHKHQNKFHRKNQRCSIM